MTRPLEVEVVADADALAHVGAAHVATALDDAIAARGVATLALSGGRTPRVTHLGLSNLDIDWARVHVLQVDERQVGRDDPDRNLAGLREALLDRVPIPGDHVHALPVEASDLDRAALEYEGVLREVACDGIDVVQLGLGADGHTASLVPADPALEVEDRLVAATGSYHGHRRLTLTYPALRAAHRIVWIVSGTEKAAAVRQLATGDKAIPAGRVARDNAILICDRSAWDPVEG